MQVLGSISGSGKITLKDKNAPPDSQPPVDLDLEKVLGKMPRKTFEFTRRQEEVRADLDLSQLSSPQEAISRVLRLPSVGSKRFLTTKVDRCVTGKIEAQHFNRLDVITKLIFPLLLSSEVAWGKSGWCCLKIVYSTLPYFPAELVSHPSFWQNEKLKHANQKQFIDIYQSLRSWKGLRSSLFPQMLDGRLHRYRLWLRRPCSPATVCWPHAIAYLRCGSYGPVPFQSHRSIFALLILQSTRTVSVILKATQSLVWVLRRTAVLRGPPRVVLTWTQCAAFYDIHALVDNPESPGNNTLE